MPIQSSTGNAAGTITPAPLNSTAAPVETNPLPSPMDVALTSYIPDVDYAPSLEPLPLAVDEGDMQVIQFTSLDIPVDLVVDKIATQITTAPTVRDPTQPSTWVQDMQLQGVATVGANGVPTMTQAALQEITQLQNQLNQLNMTPVAQRGLIWRRTESFIRGRLVYLQRIRGIINAWNNPAARAQAVTAHNQALIQVLQARLQIFLEIYDNWNNIPPDVRSQLNDSRDQARQWRDITQNTITSVTQLNS